MPDRSRARTATSLALALSLAVLSSCSSPLLPSDVPRPRDVEVARQVGFPSAALAALADGSWPTDGTCDALRGIESAMDYVSATRHVTSVARSYAVGADGSPDVTLAMTQGPHAGEELRCRKADGRWRDSLVYVERHAEWEERARRAASATLAGLSEADMVVLASMTDDPLVLPQGDPSSVDLSSVPGTVRVWLAPRCGLSDGGMVSCANDLFSSLSDAGVPAEAHVAMLSEDPADDEVLTVSFVESLESDPPGPGAVTREISSCAAAAQGAAAADGTA